jgi:hypothetical protein
VRLASAASMAAFLLILSLMVVTGAVAQPGDLMYPFKIAAERTRLSGARGEKEVALRIKFLRTRVHEIESMVGDRRPGSVVLAVRVYEEHVAGSVDTLTSLGQEYAVDVADLRAADRVFFEAEEELAELLPSFSGRSRSWVERALWVTTTQRDELAETFPTMNTVSSSEPLGNQ